MLDTKSYIGDLLKIEESKRKTENPEITRIIEEVIFAENAEEKAKDLLAQYTTTTSRREQQLKLSMELLEIAKNAVTLAQSPRERQEFLKDMSYYQQEIEELRQNQQQENTIIYKLNKLIEGDSRLVVWFHLPEIIWNQVAKTNRFSEDVATNGLKKLYYQFFYIHKDYVLREIKQIKDDNEKRLIDNFMRDVIGSILKVEENSSLKFFMDPELSKRMNNFFGYNEGYGKRWSEFLDIINAYYSEHHYNLNTDITTLEAGKQTNILSST